MSTDRPLALWLEGAGLSILLDRIQTLGFLVVEELGHLPPEDVAQVLGSEPAVNLRQKRVFESLWRGLRQDLETKRRPRMDCLEESKATTEAPPRSLLDQLYAQQETESRATKTSAGCKEEEQPTHVPEGEEAIGGGAFNNLCLNRLPRLQKKGTGKYPTKIYLKSKSTLPDFIESQGIAKADQLWTPLPTGYGYQLRVVD